MSTQLRCMVCDGGKLNPLFTSKGYPIVRCEQCGFCQVAQIPDASELNQLYTDLHAKHVNFRDVRAAQRENQSRLALVKRYMQEGANLLDAGCATGDFIAEAKSHFSMHGVDISEGAVATARVRFPDLSDRLNSLRLEDLNAQGHQFDGVCLWDVIEHVPDPVSVIRKLMSMLSPGGYLFLSTPDMGSLSARIMRRHWAFMIPPLHLGYFNRRSFTHLFEKQAPGNLLCMETRGKWTSLAFLFYKLGQIHPMFAPAGLMRMLRESALGKLNLYVPTNDIMYLAIRKPDSTS